METPVCVCFQARFVRVDKPTMNRTAKQTPTPTSPTVVKGRATVVQIIHFLRRRRKLISFKHLVLAGVWPTASPLALHALSYSSPLCAVCLTLQILGNHQGPNGGGPGMIQAVESVQPL